MTGPFIILDCTVPLVVLYIQYVLYCTVLTVQYSTYSTVQYLQYSTVLYCR